MRFNPKQLLSPIYMLLIASVYVLYLWISGQLDLYIHPRYIIFTGVAAVITLVLSMVYISNNDRDPSEIVLSKIDILLIIVLGLGLFLPARTLSSSTFGRRLASDNLAGATDSRTSAPLLFSGSSRGLRIGDWAQTLQSERDASYFATKPANFSGFLYDAGLGPDTVWLARFAVTCCAVDAQPIGVPVLIDGWQDTYQSDEWLEVEGVFVETEVDGQTFFALEISDIKQIDEPDNPYVN